MPVSAIGFSAYRMSVSRYQESVLSVQMDFRITIPDLYVQTAECIDNIYKPAEIDPEIIINITFIKICQCAHAAFRSIKTGMRQFVTLVSGNAEGADRTAQKACLGAGGRVLAVLPDNLLDHEPGRGEAFLCEQGWHLPFTAWRALRRNLLIHALGELTLVCQSGTSGGTWNGCTENLKRGLSPVYIRRDGSPGAEDLISRGANGIDELTALRVLRPQNEQIPL